jgi:hypothetical protein
MALPPEYVYSAIFATFNPRCEPPWTDREIAHKVRSAVTRANLPWDSLAPEGWDEALSQLVAECKDRNDPVRRLTQASMQEVYTFNPYTDTMAEGLGDAPRRMISLSDAVQVLCVSPVWKGVFRYDVFRETTIAVRPPCALDAEKGGGVSLEDVSRVQIWFEVNGCKIGEKVVQRAIEAAARGRVVDDLAEYVNTLDTTAIDVAQAQQNITHACDRWLQAVSPRAAEYLTKWMVAAIDRALSPGSRVDCMLVLVGSQGLGKTTAIQALFGREWYREQMPDLQGRDASHALRGKWVVEFGELDKVLRADPKTVKDFLSRACDHYRQFGSGQEIERPRRCVFVGTCNELDFLRGDTDYRRFLPIEIGAAVDTQSLRDARHTLWASALVLYRAGFVHWVTQEDLEHLSEVQHGYREVDPWTDAILDAVDGREATTTAEAYVAAFGALDLTATQKLTPAMSRRVAQVLLSNGWRVANVFEAGRKRQHGKPGRPRTVYVPPIANASEAV